jgi:hypothetical protein
MNQQFAGQSMGGQNNIMMQQQQQQQMNVMGGIANNNSNGMMMMQGGGGGGNMQGQFAPMGQGQQGHQQSMHQPQQQMGEKKVDQFAAFGNFG